MTKRCMTRRAAILSGLPLALGLAACGGSQQEESPQEAGSSFAPSLDTETACKLTIAGTYDNFEALEAEFDSFRAHYPNVDLSYVKLDDYDNVIGTTLEGDEAPNIYFIWPWMSGKEPYEGVFDAAEDLSDASLGIDLDCIRDGVLFRLDDGTVPMVPVFTTTQGMLVNEDLFEKEGVAIPTTYEELLAACQTFAERGYVSPVMAYMDSVNTYLRMIYGDIAYHVNGNAEAIEQLNALQPEAGEYLRHSMELLEDFLSHGYLNREACAEIADDYEAAILRFFEGDVPMMVATGDLASGTRKREGLSEAFSANPFGYSLHPLPITDVGGVFLSLNNICFALNKNGENVDMANEFMRFLVRADTLNEMAEIKRLVTPCKDMGFDDMYASFGEVDEEHTISEQDLGLTDDVAVQLRGVTQYVGNSEGSIDEALAKFGTY